MANARSLLRPESTALVVIDLQEKLVPAIDGVERVLENTRKLLQLAKVLPLKTVVTTQYRQGLGPTVTAIAELIDAEPLDKVCFGCLGDDGFRAQLDRMLPQGGALLLAGIEAHICVLQTALGALDAGYQVHLAADATGSRSAANAVLGLERVRQAGAVISSTEMAIYELLGNSRRPEFKQMLPFLR
jgi:nicotinamidase-related amidase